MNDVKFTKIFNLDVKLRKKLLSVFIVAEVSLIETFTK